jgi:murein DD-endopeptidase MepM/ murein hydrolase activator NlpD
MLATLLVTTVVAAPPSAIHVAVVGSIDAALTHVLPHEGGALAAQVARLLRWRGDIVKNIHRGDDLQLVYESEPQPELVALKYRGSEISLSAYRYLAEDGQLRFYDEEGRLIEPVLKNAPTAVYTQITELVQHGRGKRKHAGIDLKAPEGTPVRLPFEAQVLRVNWSRRVNGNCVEVAYPEGRIARFLHLARVAKGLQAGMRLQPGAEVGTVGSTGHSLAPHLHYEIRDPDDRPIDPLVLHGTTHDALPASARQAFAAARARQDTLLEQAVASARHP